MACRGFVLPQEVDLECSSSVQPAAYQLSSQPPAYQSSLVQPAYQDGSSVQPTNLVWYSISSDSSYHMKPGLMIKPPCNPEKESPRNPGERNHTRPKQPENIFSKELENSIININGQVEESLLTMNSKLLELVEKVKQSLEYQNQMLASQNENIAAQTRKISKQDLIVRMQDQMITMLLDRIEKLERHSKLK